jgi:hypothetical protein
MEKLAGGRVSIRMAKPVRKERLVGGSGNRRMGKPGKTGKVGRMEGKWKDGETC